MCTISIKEQRMYSSMYPQIRVNTHKRFKKKTKNKIKKRNIFTLQYSTSFRGADYR